MPGEDRDPPEYAHAILLPALLDGLVRKSRVVGCDVYLWWARTNDRQKPLTLLI